MKTSNFLGLSTEGFHNIVYSEWGEPSSNFPSILCVHGLLRNRHDFDSLACYLSAQGRHVVCPDIVGRGDSDWFKNPQHYTFQQYIADMSILIGKLASPKIDWIGTSMGGLIGMMIAALPNSPINRLVLNDVGAQIPLNGLRRLARYANEQERFSTKEEAKKYYQRIYSNFGHLSTSQWDDITEHNIKLHLDGSYVAKCDPHITHNKTHSQFMWELIHHPHKTLEGIWFDIDLWSTWHQVRCPVLMIHGEHSDILLSEHIDKMQKIHPKTDVMEVKNTGHAPPLLELTQQEQISTWLKT